MSIVTIDDDDLFPQDALMMHWWFIDDDDLRKAQNNVSQFAAALPDDEEVDVATVEQPRGNRGRAVRLREEANGDRADEAGEAMDLGLRKRLNNIE